MFRSFHIQNFRCFRDLKLDNLERVNLIAGQNNVGKTALLEALFLHIAPNNPTLSARINIQRGFHPLSSTAKEMWKYHFFDFDVDKEIVLTEIDDDRNSSSLHISLEEPKNVQLISSEPSENGTRPSLSTALDTRQLKLEYHDPKGEVAISWGMLVNESEMRSSIAPLPQVRQGSFLGTGGIAQENADRFSELSRSKRQKEILEALSLLEPRLEYLEVQSVGGVPFIWGDIGLSQLLPITMLGQGVVRLLTIILAIKSTSPGIILIDEIENGLHYSVMEKVWTAIAQAARDADVQVFATTHSWECITAAHRAFSESEQYDFRLHRLDRIGEDIRAVTLTQRMLETAIQSGLEVR